MPRLNMKKMKKMNKKSVRRSKTAKGGKRRKSKRTLRGGDAEDEGAATPKYKTAVAKLSNEFGLSGEKITGIYFNDILFMDNTSVTGIGGIDMNQFYHYKPIQSTEELTLIGLGRNFTSHHSGNTSPNI